MHRTVLVAFLSLWLAACGSEDGTADEAADGTRDAAAASASSENEKPGDPRDVTFAPALRVDLNAMERRESGLYVQVLAEGDGPAATVGDSLYVHYTVWFPDGRKLDSSFDHRPPEPLPMRLGETPLIEGWSEGVTGMRPGERRRLVVPSDLGYGEAGRPPQVPPFATLVFEVERIAPDAG